MRWDQLFADLTSQFDLLAEADLAAELPDRQRHAVGRLSTVQRCAGAVGQTLSVRMRSGVTHTAVLRDVGPDWLRLGGDVAQTLLALGAVTTVEGLTSDTHVGLSPVAARFDLRLALRGVARDRAPVAVTVSGGVDQAGATEVAGTIDRVGSDYIEVAQHASWEPRRAAAVRSVALMPLGAVESVRSIAGG